ncbi:hypothetical protein J6590_024763 [Homalodisca vitripennis]|nr:hypothetical protein J6590_091355 [Homalodisca vitripennis]KAG8317537.1 hypothetical protein J6590_024763 [Homalodisca vitripennis]
MPLAIILLSWRLLLRKLLAASFSFTPVSEADVLAAFTRMTSNAVGADNIPLRFLKDTLPITLF